MNKYLVIDTETTGLHPAKNGLIQVAAIALGEKLEIQAEFLCDVNPGEVEYSPESFEIHGIGEERIQKGLSYSEFCQSFLGFVRSNFQTQPIAVGQFYPFDYAFLDYVFTVSGYESVMNRDVLSNKFIDTKSLVLSLNLKAELAGRPAPFPVTSLSKAGGLKDKYGFTDKYQAHDAMGDVLATREVLIKILEEIKI